MLVRRVTVTSEDLTENSTEPILTTKEKGIYLQVLSCGPDVRELEAMEYVGELLIGENVPEELRAQIKQKALQAGIPCDRLNFERRQHIVD